ncbi:MAG: Fe-S cluster assembly sulfur transfer protein SufU [Bacteroidota bacterium]
MSLLSDLYSEIILEHYKQPHNFGELEGAEIEAKGYNRSCGDDLRIFVKLNDGVIEDLRFMGKGCAISQSSASMMTDQMIGKSLEEVKEFVEEFRKMVTGEKNFLEGGGFEELVTLKGVKKYPTRVKCASLAWDTLKEGISDFEARNNGSAT